MPICQLIYLLSLFLVDLPANVSDADAARGVYERILDSKGGSNPLQVCGKSPCESACGDVHIAHGCRRDPSSLGEIYISKEAAHACRTFGPGRQDACFALVFGHELAHLRLGHDLQIHQNFSASNDELLAMERKADRYGFSTATLLGYDISSDGDRFLDALYKEPNVNQAVKTAQANDLNDNRQDWTITDQKYQAANVLFGVGQYLPAANLFSDVVDVGGDAVPAAQNSMAVSLIFASASDYGVIKKLPFLVSSVSPLAPYQAQILKGTDDSQKLLQQAEKALKKLVDSGYSPAVINYALIHSISPEWGSYRALDQERLRMLVLGKDSYSNVARLSLAIIDAATSLNALKGLSDLSPQLMTYRDAWLANPPKVMTPSSAAVSSTISLPKLTAINGNPIPDRETSDWIENKTVHRSEWLNGVAQVEDLTLSTGNKADGLFLGGRAGYGGKANGRHVLYFLVARPWSGGKAASSKGSSCLAVGTAERDLICLGKVANNWMSGLGEGRLYDESNAIVWLDQGAVKQFALYQWAQ